MGIEHLAGCCVFLVCWGFWEKFTVDLLCFYLALVGGGFAFGGGCLGKKVAFGAGGVFS